jgi:hypothetical protein
MASEPPKEQMRSIMFGCPGPAPTMVPKKGQATKVHTMRAPSVAGTRWMACGSEKGGLGGEMQREGRKALISA